MRILLYRRFSAVYAEALNYPFRIISASGIAAGAVGSGGLVMKLVNVSELKIGMSLAQNVYTVDDQLVMPKGGCATTQY